MTSDEICKQYLLKAVSVFYDGINTEVAERRVHFAAQLAAGAQLQLTVIMLPTVRIVCRIGGEQAFAYDVEMTLPIDPMKFN